LYISAEGPADGQRPFDIILLALRLWAGKEAADLRIEGDIETIAPSELGGRFPYLHVDPDFTGYFERMRAGYINPRALVRAQAKLAEQGGVSLIEA
ncbi:hypothetical protein AB9F39_35345, partial [Rhizobium leguminosarum]